MNAMSQPPVGQSVEAEQGLLGCILRDGSAFDLVSDIVQVDHLFDPVHQRIFHLCATRIGKGHLASPMAIAPIMATDAGLNSLGGQAYLMRLAAVAPDRKFVRDYGKMVVEQAGRRALQEAAIQAQQALSDGVDASEVKSGLQLALHSVPEASGEESSVSLLKAVVRSVEAANRAYQGEQGFLKTGIDALDSVLRGLGPGDFMLLGGATSMGKTSLALEIAGNVAIHQRKSVGFWSLEMTDDQLAARLASARSRVPYANLRDAHDMPENDFRAWIEASQAIADAPLRIVPKHIRDLAAGHAALRRVKREFGNKLDLVIVDYAQLVRGMGKSRFEQMTEVSIGLKSMAGMLGCPLIGLVQLSRQIGERDDKRPQLSDIKETGQFENDADQVVFCHREGYWMERQGPKADRGGNITEEAKLQWEADLRAVQNVMEVIVRKNRHGRLATAQVGFHAPENRFWRLGQRDDVAEYF